MKRTKHTPEQSIRKPGEANRLLTENTPLAEVVRHLGVSHQTSQHSRTQYGLRRQYFPGDTDLSRRSPDDLVAAAAALNGRPRKTHCWKTPAEALDHHLEGC